MRRSRPAAIVSNRSRQNRLRRTPLHRRAQRRHHHNRLRHHRNHWLTRRAEPANKRKTLAKQAKVITNDNIPKEGGISAVGEEPPAAENAENAPSDAAKSDKTAKSDEDKWRARFDKLHHKLEQDQADLEVMQRELGVLNLQYYNDPVKAMQQDLTRSDINEKTAKIAAKEKEIEADKQAISDAEDDLRQAGGDPGWAR